MYTFLFINPNGTIPAFEFAAAPDPEAARHEARRMLEQRPERRAVEVWSATERLAVIQRESAEPG